MMAASAPLSDDIDFYRAEKVFLDKSISDGFCPMLLSTKRVGLVNQGATCYLNSLMQLLFYDLDFRTLILETVDDSPILVALHHLFARLQLSSSISLSTKDLVAAFGWSRSDVFEQHDVHELFSVLLDAIGECSATVGVQLSSLYRSTTKGLISHFINFPY